MTGCAFDPTCATPYGLALLIGLMVAGAILIMAWLIVNFTIGVRNGWMRSKRRADVRKRKA